MTLEVEVNTRKPVEEVSLSYAEIKRYGRHLIIPEVGLNGQKKLKAASVLIVGAGGLGSPLSLYLAAAGVGRIGLVDFDRVDSSNLQRQILYTELDVGKPKLEVAKARLEAMNPYIEVETYETRLTSENALEIMEDYDVIVDGTDNFPTRYLVNDASVLLGKPNVYGSIFRFDGQVSVFYAKHGPCYRCLYPEPPPPGLVPSCAEGGVLGVLPGIIGALQANEVIKLILGVGEPLIGRLLLFDALHMSFRELKVKKDRSCPVCGENPRVRELIDYEAFCGLTQEQQAQASTFQITPEELKEKLERGERIILLDVREPVEYEICRLEGATLVPLSKLPEYVNRLSQTEDIVVYCHTGMRSAMAVKLLRDLGFTRVKNLAGGIDAWAVRIDPKMPRY
ncbi:MAG TPA: molybdopterin-synthase adenylyltransferase MoeB [Candidatus Caldiarchaeum subterraneum]|uniref:Molybdopterin-synthase adenylyltransferase MoeB n=1 Tax=Caldiarchaeum subterraneum TaxID=311458 RepID=A0A832ZW87_CALS0|nr:molybdopterin-synthase adenylyltransferase MoeB [Candidatus Caldarchaeum subterraneum]